MITQTLQLLLAIPICAALEGMDAAVHLNNETLRSAIEVNNKVTDPCLPSEFLAAQLSVAQRFALAGSLPVPELPRYSNDRLSGRFGASFASTHVVTAPSLAPGPSPSPRERGAPTRAGTG
jgi:hypothetical protein